MKNWADQVHEPKQSQIIKGVEMNQTVKYYLSVLFNSSGIKHLYFCHISPTLFECQ